MGRKIPARKHFGIRDPVKQNEERFALIKDKINNPPEKRDFQKVSHSFARFIKLKEDAKKQSTKPTLKKHLKRITNSNEDKPGYFTKKNKKQPKQTVRSDKDFSNLHQRPNESDHGFMRRVNRVTKESVEEAKFEAKYGVDVIRNPKTGEIQLKKRPTNEIDERLKANVANLKKKGKGKSIEPIVIPAEERKRLAKEMIKEKKEKQSADEKPVVEEFKRDIVKFGEVVQAPPQLPLPRLAKKAETVPRPGQKPLILRAVINNFTNVDVETASPNRSIPKNTIKKAGTIQKKDNSLKGKRKDLSLNMRNMIETEQKNAVKHYKELKKSQRSKNKI